MLLGFDDIEILLANIKLTLSVPSVQLLIFTKISFCIAFITLIGWQLRVHKSTSLFGIKMTLLFGFFILVYVRILLLIWLYAQSFLNKTPRCFYRFIGHVKTGFAFVWSRVLLWPLFIFWWPFHTSFEDLINQLVVPASRLFIVFI